MLYSPCRRGAGTRAKPDDRRGTAAEHAHFGILLELVLEHGLDQRVSDVPAIESFAHGVTWAASEADARWQNREAPRRPVTRIGRSFLLMTTAGMTELESTLASLAARFDDAVASASDARALDEVRVAFLGRSGEVTAVRRGIGKLPPAERGGAGKVINAAVESFEAKLAAATARVERAALDASLGDTIDVTFPGPAAAPGRDPPGAPSDDRRRALFHPPRLRGRARARDRDRREQLRRAQHPARPPRARRAGLVLPAARICCCARTPRRCRCAPCAPTRRRSR